MGKSPIGDKMTIWFFELGIGVFSIGDWGLKSPISIPKNINPKFKIVNRQFYHHLVC